MSDPMTDPADRFADLTLAEFLDRLASPEPIPGGGSASAIAASLAGALLAMVARLSTGRPKYAEYAATHERAETAGAAAAARFLELADQDAAAYGAFAKVMKLPRETPEEQEARAGALREAARESAAVPMEMLRACRSLAEDIEAMAGRSNLNAASDISVAALLVDAAAHGAAANVLVNLPSVKDERFEAITTADLMLHLKAIEDLSAHAREVVAGGRLRDPEAG
jgi:formiminotetrahydrofolate cyclodeaminase